ncbi:MAG: rRNA pseudouridine synthase [Candidatus Kapaibacterium sp.]|nr:MAG: rRNA pseudouridine synthase [Candidatus Kapabacteria bacterium]
MKKSPRPAPKTGIISRSGGKTSFRKLDPNAPPKSRTKPTRAGESPRSRTARPDTDDETKPARKTSAPARKLYGDKKSEGKKFGDKKFGEKKFGEKKFDDKKSAEKKFGEKKFEDKKFEDKKFEDKKFGEKKFDDKKLGEKKFGEKKFGEKRFEGRKFEGKRVENEHFSTKKSDRTSHKAVSEAAASAKSSPQAGKGGKRPPSTKASNTALLRLNKYIADAGICSRRQADEYIEQGRVKVNGKLVTEQGMKVHLADLVTVNGEPINAEKHLTYVVLNKPKDYITTTSDEKGRKTVMELIPLKQRIYPIGRLDRHTTGVLLLTNDGDLAHRLMHPSYEVSRIYRVYIDKRLTQNDMRNISKGVKVEDENGDFYISGECNIAIDPEDPRAVTVELAEGKNREVRRIFAALGYEVEKLDRKAYAGISSRGLGRGEYRHLSPLEVRALEQLVKLDHRLENATTAAKTRTKARR